jgi:hypothetical protein
VKKLDNNDLFSNFYDDGYGYQVVTLKTSDISNSDILYAVRGSSYIDTINLDGSGYSLFYSTTSEEFDSLAAIGNSIYL